MDLRELLRGGLIRKRRASRVASWQGDQNPAGGMTDTSGEMAAPAYTQDEFSVRAKNSGKGKKTADKWNQ